MVSTPKPTARASSPFFPLATGDTWTYKQLTVGDDISTTTVSLTVASTSLGADGTVTADVVRTIVISPTPQLSPQPQTATFTVAADGSVSATPANPPNSPASLLIPATAVIRSGQAVPVGSTITSQGFVAENSRFITGITAHGGGVSSVTVPAGTFTAQLLVVDAILPGAQPCPFCEGGPGPSGTWRITYWLVDGVGLVKSVVTNSTGYRVIRELTSYHLGRSG